jgi:hypothetical protein
MERVRERKKGIKEERFHRVESTIPRGVRSVEA